MHRLFRTARDMADFFEGGLADQIRTDTIEHDRGTHTAFFERLAFQLEKRCLMVFEVWDLS